MNAKHAACFLLAGAATGAAIALLYAPQSGARTQRDLKRFAGKTSDRLQDLQEDVRDHMSCAVDGVTTAVKGAVDRARNFGSEGYKRVLQTLTPSETETQDGKSPIKPMSETA